MTRKNALLFLIIYLVVFILLCLVTGPRGIIVQNSLKQEIVSLEKRKTGSELELKSLESRYPEEKDRAFARGYVKPGDKVFRFAPDSESVQETEAATPSLFSIPFSYSLCALAALLFTLTLMIFYCLCGRIG